MSGLVRFIIKFVVYIFIVIPVVRALVGIIIPWGWLSWILGFIAAISVALWLERTGTANKILGMVSGKAKTTVNQATGKLFSVDGKPPAPTGVETTEPCTGCGTLVALVDGRGKCEACGGVYVA